MTDRVATLGNGRAIDLGAIPSLTFDDFAQTILDAVAGKQRVSAYFAVPTADTTVADLYAVLADDVGSRLHVTRSRVRGDSFPSLALRCPQVHLFEREIAEQTGLRPLHHPGLTPVRYHHSWVTGRDAWDRPADQLIIPGSGPFCQVAGDEIHEVAVGPVHAGVIEPGHFRFQCHGEHVFHLDIALGYQHRGVEEALLGGPTKRSLHYAETLAGDSTIAHGTAYCEVLEALGRCRRPARAQALRGIALELERLANHVGDLGALAGDVGFLPTASYCGRIRGDLLNLSALLCGSRFGRGTVRPGGVRFDLEPARRDDLQRRLDAIGADAASAINLLWSSPSVMARFEEIGRVTAETARDLGLVGPAARASGLRRDIRHDHPSGIFSVVHVPICTCETGDVFARANVRWLEIQQSLLFIGEQLQALPGGALAAPPAAPAADSLAIALVEGWRGEVCHVAITDAAGRFSRYKVVDPSFHNWSGLAHALRGQQISDFPVCNKSFNLSYCGHDL